MSLSEPETDFSYRKTLLEGDNSKCRKNKRLRTEKFGARFYL